MKNNIIAQTARDYDMDYEEVEAIYMLYANTQMFYDKLEEKIKERSKNGF